MKWLSSITIWDRLPIAHSTSGKVPVTGVDPIFMLTNSCRLENVSGSVPVNRLLERSNDCNAVRFPIVYGNVLFSRLLDKISDSSFVKLPIDIGIDPFIPNSLRFSPIV